jgi:hypothetical protein
MPNAVEAIGREIEPILHQISLALIGYINSPLLLAHSKDKINRGIAIDECGLYLFVQLFFKHSFMYVFRSSPVFPFA